MLETAKKRSQILQSPFETRFNTENVCTPNLNTYRHNRLCSADNQSQLCSEQHIDNHLQTKMRMHTLGKKSFNRSVLKQNAKKQSLLTKRADWKQSY
jgi:hypothetical protein